MAITVQFTVLYPLKIFTLSYIWYGPLLLFENCIHADSTFKVKSIPYFFFSNSSLIISTTLATFCIFVLFKTLNKLNDARIYMEVMLYPEAWVTPLVLHPWKLPFSLFPSNLQLSIAPHLAVDYPHHLCSTFQDSDWLVLSQVDACYHNGCEFICPKVLMPTKYCFVLFVYYLWFFILSIHSFKVPHESWKNRHDIDVLIGIEHATVSCPLHFDELYVSVTQHLYRRRLLWWGLEHILIYVLY